ncbi:hypothetical protein FOCG_10612 [Fusarium oxysporum f. sp. radicis-lycopersici 26381]|nr:hypothetical protein FOCG_10612 [Fusarium oxysporum f. sp. radicis-lycopersici 26381]
MTTRSCSKEAASKKVKLDYHNLSYQLTLLLLRQLTYQQTSISTFTSSPSQHQTYNPILQYNTIVHNGSPTNSNFDIPHNPSLRSSNFSIRPSRRRPMHAPHE